MYMKIVVISECTYIERYIIDQIILHYPDVIVVKPLYRNVVAGYNVPAYYLPNKLAVAWIQRICRKLYREIATRKFFSKLNAGNNWGELVAIRADLSLPEGIQTIHELSPDVLITCSAPMLSPEIIQQAKIAAINIHFGIAPSYRGHDTLFWPLFYGDHHMIGACIHHLSKGVDRGSILAEVYPSLSPKDGEIDIDIKTTLLLNKPILQILKLLEKSGDAPEGKHQQGKGRNFKSSERTLIINFKYLVKKWLGLTHLPARNARIICHF